MKIQRKYPSGPCLAIFSVYYKDMETLSRARAVVEKAEKDLRQLLSEAAASGEYDSVVTLADWAKQLAALMGPVNTVPANNSPRSAAPSGVKQPSLDQDFRPKKKTKREIRKEYPKFLQDKNDLVKIGWSKSEKSPYEHRAPKSVIAVLAQALMRVGRAGRRFSMDEILPLKQSGGDGEVPSYQAYLALAWFRVESLVKQHGRQGYSLREGVNLAEEAERCWGKLLTR